MEPKALQQVSLKKIKASSFYTGSFLTKLSEKNQIINYHANRQLDGIEKYLLCYLLYVDNLHILP